MTDFMVVNDKILIGEEITFVNNSLNATSYEWQQDGYPIATTQDLAYTFLATGIYNISLLAFEGNGCVNRKTICVVVAPKGAGVSYEPYNSPGANNRTGTGDDDVEYEICISESGLFYYKELPSGGTSVFKDDLFDGGDFEAIPEENLSLDGLDPAVLYPPDPGSGEEQEWFNNDYCKPKDGNFQLKAPPAPHTNTSINLNTPNTCDPIYTPPGSGTTSTTYTLTVTDDISRCMVTSTITIESDCSGDCTCADFTGITESNPFNLNAWDLNFGGTFMDVDNDGDFDLVFGFGNVSFYENIGDQHIPDFDKNQSLLITTDYTFPQSYDYNQDGFDDFFALDPDTGEIIYFENQGLPGVNFSEYPTGVILPISLNDVYAFTIGDLSNDGLPDLIYSQIDEGNVKYWEHIPGGDCTNNGAPCFQQIGNNESLVDGLPPVQTNPQPYPELHDVDCDGDLDLFIGMPGAMALYENYGTIVPPGTLPDIETQNYQLNPIGIVSGNLITEFYCGRFVDIDADNAIELFVDDATKIMFFDRCTDGTPLPGECEEDNLQYLTTAISSGTYHAKQTLEAAVPVESAANVTFKAGITISLLPGFEVPPGTDFLAKIEQCTLLFTPEEGEEDQATNRADNQPLDNLNKDEWILRAMPNPFRSSTTIQFILPENVESGYLKLSNITGEGVLLFFEDRPLEAGTYELSLDGALLSPGIYILNLKVDEQILTEKLVLIKD